MKVNSTHYTPPVSVTPTGAGVAVQNSSYVSVLKSPYAPTWPATLQKILEKISNLFYFLFSWILPLKVEQNSPQSDGVLKTIYLAEEEKRKNQFSITRECKNVVSETIATIGQGIIPCGISWYQGNSNVLSAFFAKKGVDVTAKALERIANYTFHFFPVNWRKMASIGIAAPVIWITADRLGYPQGYFFFFGVAMSIVQLNMQGQQVKPV